MLQLGFVFSLYGIYLNESNSLSSASIRGHSVVEDIIDAQSHLHGQCSDICKWHFPLWFVHAIWISFICKWRCAKNELVHSHIEHLCQPLLYCCSSSPLKWPNGTRKQTDLLNWRSASNARSTPQSPVQWHVKGKRRADQTAVAFWHLQLPLIYTRAGVETASVSGCHSQMFCGHSAVSQWQLRI